MKYFYDEDRLDPKLLPLYFIANELAEKNRLKRIELNLKMYAAEIRTTPKNLERFDKELEDQV